MESQREYPQKPDACYLFGTCLIDGFFPRAGVCAIRLLQREGIRVIFPPHQTCCGQPAYNSGYHDDAREVARRQVALFPKNYPIVVPSGSCAAMMKHHYPALFAGDPLLSRVQDFAARVYELTEFLVHVAKVKITDRGEPVRVTWHSSCHALREMHIDGEPRSLLAQLANVDLVPLERETECCGFGGTFAVKQPEISAEMVRDKIDDIAQTGADVVLSTDCGCLLNIDGAIRHAGKAIRVCHMAEFLWERTYATPA